MEPGQTDNYSFTQILKSLQALKLPLRTHIEVMYLFLGVWGFSDLGRVHILQ